MSYQTLQAKIEQLIEKAQNGGGNKLAQVVGETATEITAADLAGCTKVGSYAFYQYTPLTSVTLPDGVSFILNYAFYGCTGLTSITIPSGVTSIANYVFAGCTGLASITIPNTVAMIGSYALDIGSSTNKATIRMLPTMMPPMIQSNTIGANVEKIIVPAGKLAAYQAATNWSAYASIMEEATA